MRKLAIASFLAFSAPMTALAACPTPADVSGFVPPSSVHAYNPPAMKCTSQQIQDFYTNCIDTNATNQTCTNWSQSQSNKDCAGCVYTQETAPSWGPVVAGQGLVSLNVAGCLALSGASACALSYEKDQACGKAACELVCPVTDNQSFTLYQQCRSTASNGGCKPYADQTAVDCPSTSQLVKTCVDFADFQTGYTNLAGLFCGGAAPPPVPPPQADAGKSDSGSTTGKDGGVGKDGGADAGPAGFGNVKTGCATAPGGDGAASLSPLALVGIALLARIRRRRSPRQAG